MKTRFNSIDPKFISQRKSVHELCRQFSRSPSKGNLKRLKEIFAQCGEQVFIESGFHCDYGDNISLGHNVFINVNCTILDGKAADKKNEGKKQEEEQETEHYFTVNNHGEIRIGDDCLIGPNVQLLAVSHDVDPIERLKKYNYIDSIVIGKNVWLGGGVIVLAGVTIGDNSVVAAGSVVTKNIEENSFYAGNPAVKIRTL